MREIGSEFWNIPTTTKKNTIFPKATRWYLSGRSALKGIIKELSWIKTVAMPTWCCDSMVKPFIDGGIKVHFYPVYWKNGIVQEIRLDCDALFLMDYFGYTSLSDRIIEYHGVVIRDITHSIFSTRYSDADYYFGSLRKWCGVYTGGYAWTKDGHTLPMEKSDDYGYTALREKAMILKNFYMNKCSDADGILVENKRYLKFYEEAEGCLENVDVVSAAERDIGQAEYIDFEFITHRRRTNAKILMSAFSEQLIFSLLDASDCPMFVPILVPGDRRDELRRYLIENNIYCPIHWPVSKYHHLDERTAMLFENELSLVCDQRYTEEDMYHMVEVIKSFWKKV